MKKLARLIACIAIVTILSCNKESQEYNPANLVITQIDVKTKSGNQDLPTISRFKELFNYNFFSTNFQPFNGDSTNAFSDFEPIWYLAQEIPVNNSQIVTVPLFTGYESDQISDIPAYQLVFSTNDECGETFELIIFAHSDNLEDVKNENKCYPSGAMTIINSCNCTSKFAVLEDGLPVYYNDIDMSEIPQYINDGSRFAFWDWFSDHILCYDFRTPWFERLGNWFRGKVKDFKDFFKLKDETGNSSENGGQGGIIITTTNGFPNYGSSQSNNMGGSGGYNSYEDIIYLFQNNFFNGEGTKVKNSLESLIGDYDLQICVEDLHKQLYNCLNEVANDPELCLTSGIMLPGDPNDPQDPIDPSNNFISFSDYSDLLSKIELENTSCLNDIISSVRADVDLDKGDGELICELEDIDLDIDIPTMLDIINEECGISVICKKNKLDCLKSLSAYEDDHELNLTASEEVNILNNISCISESFSDEVTDILMEDCLGPFYQIFNQLEDYSNDEKIAYCYKNSTFPDVDPPNCVGCSVGEAQVVWEDEIKALNMLECAISKLDNFNGSTPTDVKVALETHFGGTNSTLVSEYIKNIFKYIRSYPYDRGYQADDDCGNGVIAWSFPSVHFTDVRLCRPLYWQKFEIERSGTLIHEWMHLYYFAGDISYDWDEDYQELSTLQALLNADSFSEFVKEICDE